MHKLVHAGHDGQLHTLAHDVLMVPLRGLGVQVVELGDVVVHVQSEHGLELHELGQYGVLELDGERDQHDGLVLLVQPRGELQMDALE